MQVKPYIHENDSKKAQVQKMFDKISPVYDFLNGFLSLGIDRVWRKKALKYIPAETSNLLDVATGTGALAIQAAKTHPSVQIIGVDISEGMIQSGIQKINQKNLHSRISLRTGDSENLDFAEGSFQCVTAAFGVRNFENLNKGLTEMYRVLSKGGRCIVLEFSKPRIFPFKQIFGFYFRYLLPFTGKLISKDPRAYSYLYESVQLFPDYGNFVAQMEKAGFTNCFYKSLSLGICCIYIGEKSS
ncbi:MAG: bifunctional demethylmenaquinone methyltransferase/2-methoxy-6-polyprenyl-1,4-benzoquinol methylase UbiE [Saprospiraceae bacterium]|nr:bifunctional demethylmenaquinone methyltransferase/2-methoxy-6-polyprenyl-1,4-benzoquinol methylase UbiE [Saprospiraceae bacterium]